MYFRRSVCCRSLTATFLFTFLAVAVTASPSQAALVYDWSFGAPGLTGPITGTISFNSVTPGVGGTGLAPDSVIITSAPGHTFSSGYILGTEVFGSPLATPITQNDANWTIDSNDQIISGGRVFFSNANFAVTVIFDEFSLQIDEELIRV